MNDLVSTPILTNQILACTNRNYNQSMFGSLIFTIQNTGNCSYADGAPINIEKICYTYSVIGRINPIQFYLNGRQNTLNFSKNPIGQCLQREIPSSVEAEITAALNAAQATIDLAETISGLPEDEQLNALIQTSRLSAQSNLLGATALRDLIAYNYPVSSSNPYSAILNDLANAVYHHASAQNTIASLDPTAAVTTAQAQTVETDVTLGASYIIEAANALINSSPAPSSEVVTLANSAIASANYAIQQIADAVADPTYIGLLSAEFSIAQGIRSLINSIGQLPASSVNSTFVNDLESLALLDSGIFNTLEGLEATYDAATSGTPADYISTATQFFLSSSELTILALTFENEFTTALFYDSFETFISKTCCHNCNGENKVLFIENIDSLYICSLNIDLCGTIGCIPFNATGSLTNTQSLTQLGFNPFNISYLLDIPCNTPFKIAQQLTPQLSINCIAPTTAYDSTTNTFTANVFSTLCINEDTSFVTQEPAAIISSSTPIVCPTIYDNC